MASASGSLQSQGQAIEARIKTLVNNELREICRGEGLQVSGIKSQLQKRIIDYLNSLLLKGDQQQLFELRHRVYNGGKAPTAGLTPTFGSPSVISTTAPLYTSSPASMAPKAFGGQATGLTGGRPLYVTPLNFKKSPFYEIREALTRTLDMPVFSSHRNTMMLPLKLPGSYVNHLRTDSTLRILLYCAAGDGPKGTEVDITFPAQLEIKVGGEEVKANFKGLKNKPGSTRPADITGFIKREPDFQNQIHVTYALTHKIFNLVALLVRKHSVEELVQRIAQRGVISKARVISDMAMKASDPDIIATSSIMSLKDPVSYTRIVLPVRSTTCAHNQCFDASSFLQLQEQAPTWNCPICSKAVHFADLAVDQYVQEILEKTSSSVDQVNIEPDSKWSPVGANNSRSNGRSNGANGRDEDDDDSDDDIVEITKARQSVKLEALNVPFSFAKLTPPNAASMTPPVAHSNGSGPRPGQKRKSEVIDLTLSDDDDEPPAKKPHYSTPNSLPDYGSAKNGYPSYPRQTSHYALPTNGIVSHQATHQALGGTSRFINRVVNPTNTAPYSSPARSPAGSNMEPINLISSPPHRPSPPHQNYPNTMPIPTNSTVIPSRYPLPRPPDFPPRNIQDPIRSLQRNSLLNLAAGRDPNDYSPR